MEWINNKKKKCSKLSRSVIVEVSGTSIAWLNIWYINRKLVFAKIKLVIAILYSIWVFFVNICLKEAVLYLDQMPRDEVKEKLYAIPKDYHIGNLLTILVDM